MRLEGVVLSFNFSLKPRKAKKLTATVALIIPVAMSLLLSVAPSASAAVSDKCDGTSTQNTTKVTASHGKVFYIDSGQGQNLDASYVAYKIDNTDGATAKSNVWVTLDTFTGGVVKLANPRDATQSMGSLAASGTNTAFFLLKAAMSSTAAQSHVVHVYSGKPGTAGATEIYSCTFSFSKVAETIKASANKVQSVSSSTTSVLGSNLTITVNGASGTIGQGSSIDGAMLWLTPSAKSTWPTQALRLVSTQVDAWDNQGRNDSGSNNKVGSYANQLQIKDTNLLSPNVSIKDVGKVWYTAVYTFRIIGPATSAVTILPIGQISSGTQVKHTDVGTIPAASLNITSGTITYQAAATKAVSATVTATGSPVTTTFDYTVSLANSGASQLIFDQVEDIPSAGLSYVADTARFNGSTTNNAALSTTDSSKLIFPGPFTVPANSTRTLTYKMSGTCTAGTFSYQNTASAYIGQTVVGASSTTTSLTTAGGTCGQTTLTTATTTTQALPIEVATMPATSVGNTSATLNGNVDPNGIANQNIYFEWGTTSDLATFTSVTLGTQTSSATAPYAVSTALSGLSSGTVYYFRIRVGSVYGDILSFGTTEPVGTPTATTTNVLNVSVVSTTATVTLGGQIDPNQIANGAKVKFQYVTDASSGSCSSVSPSTLSSVGTLTGFVQSETDTSFEDAVYSGAYPADTEFVVSLVKDSYYCYRTVGYYNSSTANWNTEIFGTWVPILATVKSSQTISLSTPVTQTYGTASVNLATFTSTSSLTVSLSSNTTDVCEISSSGVITIKAAGVCSITGSQAGNNSYYAADPVAITFEITKKVLTVTASSPALNYGDSIPTISPIYTGGFVSPDTSSVVSSVVCTTTYTTTSAFGTTPTTSCSGATATSYSFTYVSGTVTISKRPIVVTASSPSLNYGDSIPTITPSYSANFANSETSSVVSGTVCTTTYTTTSTFGTTPTTSCSGATATNYSVTYTSGAVTMSKATLTVTSSSPNVRIGDAAPIITADYAGFRGSDTASVISGQSCSTTYTSSSGAGTYPTSCSGGSAANYVLGYVNGTVTASSSATQSITFANPGTQTYGPSFTLATPPTATSGLSVTITSNSPGVCTVSGNVVTIVGIGTCSLSASQAGGTNGGTTYSAATTVTITFTISQRPIVVTASSSSLNYGDSVPTITPSYSTNFANGDTSSVVSGIRCTNTYTTTSAAGSSHATSCTGATATN